MIIMLAPFEQSDELLFYILYYREWLPMISNNQIQFIITTLRLSLSIDFVILIFLLGEYREMRNRSVSPVKLPPFKYGILMSLSMIVLNTTAIFIGLLSEMDLFKSDSLVVFIFTAQLVFIIIISIWLSYTILTE